MIQKKYVLVIYRAAVGYICIISSFIWKYLWWIWKTCIFLPKSWQKKLVIILIAPDIPDVVHKLELIAVTDGYYSTFLKHYIAEEFVTSEDYSFSILTVLNYMCVNSASLADTLLEIFQLPSNESVCELCISTEQEDKKLVSDQLNFLLIQKDKISTSDTTFFPLIYNIHLHVHHRFPLL